MTVKVDNREEKKMSKETAVKEMVLCALFVALTAVLSQIAIPVQPVPVNLATLSVMLAGGVLGAEYRRDYRCCKPCCAARHVLPPRICLAL